MIRTVIVLALLLGALIALGIALTWEAPIALVFGSVVYLFRVLPKVTVDWPSVAVGGVAALLFALGVQWLGKQAGTWKTRWSLLAVAGVVLMFTAGLAMIALVHQVAWLFRDGRPFVVEREQLPIQWEPDSRQNLRGMASAMPGLVDGSPSLPPGGTYTASGEPLHSWMTALLPYIPYSTKGIDFDKPWNSPENAERFRTVVPPFLNGSLPDAPVRNEQDFGLAHFAANIRVFGANRGMKLSEITDGHSTTILVGEVAAGFKAWGDPTNVRDPARGLKRTAKDFSGVSGRPVLFLMADGSVKAIDERVSPEVLRAMATPAGGENVPEDASAW